MSERMLVSILSVSMDPREMLWDVDTQTQASLCGDLKAEDLKCLLVLS